MLLCSLIVSRILEVLPKVTRATQAQALCPLLRDPKGKAAKHLQDSESRKTNSSASPPFQWEEHSRSLLINDVALPMQFFYFFFLFLAFQGPQRSKGYHDNEP